MLGVRDGKAILKVCSLFSLSQDVLDMRLRFITSIEDLDKQIEVNEYV